MEAFVDINQVTKGLVVTLKIRGVKTYKWKLRILSWVIGGLVRVMRFPGGIEVIAKEEK